MWLLDPWNQFYLCHLPELCLRFQFGVDVNRPNASEQTALDIVEKFTTIKGSVELKQLLKSKWKHNDNNRNNGEFSPARLEMSWCLW